MAKIRDPARDEAKKIYLNNKGITNREIANRLNVDEKKIATWKHRDNWDSTSKKKNVVRQNEKCSTTNKKKLLQKAKAIVVQGGTLEEAADQTGLNESTLKNYSAKEKWIDQQEKFMQKVYSDLQESYGKKYIEERKKSLEMLTELRTFAYSKLAKGNLDKDNVSIINSVVNIVLKSAKGQSELLGIPEMKMYIRQEKEDKNYNSSNIDKNTAINMLKKARGLK